MIMSSLHRELEGVTDKEIKRPRERIRQGGIEMAEYESFCLILRISPNYMRLLGPYFSNNLKDKHTQKLVPETGL